MTLEEKINADIKQAMLAKNKERLEAIRAIKSAIILMKTSGEATSEEQELKMLQKLVKQRRESAELYRSQNREDLAKTEQEQADIIEAYLPAKMSEEEIRAELSKIITQTGAASPADLGKVMGVATKQLAGKADGKVISQLVKELLSN